MAKNVSAKFPPDLELQFIDYPTFFFIVRAWAFDYSYHSTWTLQNRPSSSSLKDIFLAHVLKSAIKQCDQKKQLKKLVTNRDAYQNRDIKGK